MCPVRTSSWTQTFGYDGFGNLTSKSTPSGSSETPLPGVNAAKNWLSGYSYDSNGNVGSYNSFALGYDPANRLSYATTGSFTETYGYDAANHRIERVNSSLDTVYFFSPSGKLLSMFNCLSTCTLISNRVYFGGMLLGTDGTAAQGVTLDANFDTFTWTDRLGSAQPTYPYGADIGAPPGADAPDFATYTKEGATGLEYAMNRYYSGGLGRFMTVDAKRKSAKRRKPQSWNRYSYAADDPVGRRDPSGLCDLTVAGVDQSATSQNGQDVASYGFNQITVFPFSNGANLPGVLGVASGIGDVVLGANANAAGVVIGLVEAAAQGGPINVTTFSGAAQVFTSAINYLQQQSGGSAIISLIGNITYVSPGANGTLYNNGSALILEGSSLLDAAAMVGTISGSIPVMPQAPCGHDFGCIVKFYSGLVAGRQGVACPVPFTIQQNDTSGFLNLLQGPLDVVDGSIAGDNQDWQMLAPAEEPLGGASSTVSYEGLADDPGDDDE